MQSLPCLLKHAKIFQGLPSALKASSLPLSDVPEYQHAKNPVQNGLKSPKIRKGNKIIYHGKEDKAQHGRVGQHGPTVLCQVTISLSFNFQRRIGAARSSYTARPDRALLCCGIFPSFLQCSGPGLRSCPLAQRSTCLGLPFETLKGLIRIQIVKICLKMLRLASLYPNVRLLLKNLSKHIQKHTSTISRQ